MLKEQKYRNARASLRCALGYQYFWEPANSQLRNDLPASGGRFTESEHWERTGTSQPGEELAHLNAFPALIASRSEQSLLQICSGQGYSLA